MSENKRARAVIGVLNLLAISSPALAKSSFRTEKADHQVEKLNVATLKSIESTWLKVPTACKARAFNASPVTLEDHALSKKIQSIYASFGV